MREPSQRTTDSLRHRLIVTHATRNTSLNCSISLTLWLVQKYSMHAIKRAIDSMRRGGTPFGTPKGVTSLQKQHAHSEYRKGVPPVSCEVGPCPAPFTGRFETGPPRTTRGGRRRVRVHPRLARPTCVNRVRRTGS